jgi:ribosomal protein L13
MDFSERAAGSRGRIFRGEDLSKIYGQLKEGVRTGVIKKVSGKDKEEFEMDMDTGEKTVVTKAPPKSFDDLF